MESTTVARPPQGGPRGRLRPLKPPREKAGRPPVPCPDGCPQPELINSDLFQLLYRDRRPIHGTWIPRWVVKAVMSLKDDDGKHAVRSEARARVLTELLYWFQLSFGDQRKREAQPKGDFQVRPRARVYDADGLQWVALSAREVGRRQLIPATSAVDALGWLEEAGLVVVDKARHGDTGLRPNAPGLARAYHRHTTDPIAFAEFLDENSDDLLAEWAGSMTQVNAYQKARGVTVHNCFIPIIGAKNRRRLFLARLLSQLVYYFADRTGHCRATKEIGGNLWWVSSSAKWGVDLAASESAVRSGIGELVDKGLVLKTVAMHRFPSMPEALMYTHLRPNVPVLLDRVREVAEKNPQIYVTGEAAHGETDDSDDGFD
jgi:hypothetical protein